MVERSAYRHGKSWGGGQSKRKGQLRFSKVSSSIIDKGKSELRPTGYSQAKSQLMEGTLRISEKQTVEVIDDNEDDNGEDCLVRTVEGKNDKE